MFGVAPKSGCPVDRCRTETHKGARPGLRRWRENHRCGRPFRPCATKSSTRAPIHPSTATSWAACICRYCAHHHHPDSPRPCHPSPTHETGTVALQFTVSPPHPLPPNGHRIDRTAPNPETKRHTQRPKSQDTRHKTDRQHTHAVHDRRHPGHCAPTYTLHPIHDTR